VPLSGPYIANGKVVVEETRRYTSARDLLALESANLSLESICPRPFARDNIYAGLELLA